MNRVVITMQLPKVDLDEEAVTARSASRVPCVFTVLPTGWSKFEYGTRFLAFTPEETQQLFDALVSAGYAAGAQT